MSLDAELRELEQAQKCALGALRGRIEALAGNAEDGPTIWVEKHPYMAVAGASLAGFLAAPVWRRSGRRQRMAEKESRKGGRHSAGASEAEGESNGSRSERVIDLLDLLARMAGQIMPSILEGENVPSTLTVADAGVLRDPGDLPRFQSDACPGEGN